MQSQEYVNEQLESNKDSSRKENDKLQYIADEKSCNMQAIIDHTIKSKEELIK